MAEPVGGRISQELRRVFEGAGLTQPELAEKLGVSQSTVSDWARGARMPPVRAIALVEELAQVPKGTVLRRAGYVDDEPRDVRAAIMADPHISKTTKLVLIDAYESALRRSRPSASAARE